MRRLGSSPDHDPDHHVFDAKPHSGPAERAHYRDIVFVLRAVEKACGDQDMEIQMSLPRLTARYIVIGAGIHGLSTAYHLAERLHASGRGSQADIVILDKAGIAAGASGIACGVVRNNYFQGGDARPDGAFRRGLGARSASLCLPFRRLYADLARTDAGGRRPPSMPSSRRSAMRARSSRVPPNPSAT